MPVYRLEIERGETLWVTAHDEQGAIDLAAAHLAEEIDPATTVQLKHDRDDTLVFRAEAGRWMEVGLDRQRVCSRGRSGR